MCADLVANEMGRWLNLLPTPYYGESAMILGSRACGQAQCPHTGVQIAEAKPRYVHSSRGLAGARR